MYALLRKDHRDSATIEPEWFPKTGMSMRSNLSEYTIGLPTPDTPIDVVAGTFQQVNTVLELGIALGLES